MASLKDLINLAKVDGGKFFVMDESGEAKLVIMGIEEYQRLLLGKLQRQIVDIEKINTEILKAQLQEDEVQASEPLQEPKRGQAPLHTPVVLEHRSPRQPDLREEVIDPSFDFEAPKLDLEEL